jgi:hypothetical protein
MDKAIVSQNRGEVIEQVIINGDLSKLTPESRIEYYRGVCRSLGLNPLTKPFDYITLNGKLTLYAKRDATDQLRKIHQVSVAITGRERIDDVYVVSAKASTPDGREDESIGAVNVLNLRGDALANALMKAETKAKRRVTLSIVGLGWLDETEIDTVPVARPVSVDMETGEVIEPEAGTVVSVPKPTSGGNGHTEKPYRFPSTAAEKFYKTVQAATDNYYSNGFHLLGVIGGQWFKFDNPEIWAEKLSVAVDHARMKREAAKPVEIENQAAQAELFNN